MPVHLRRRPRLRRAGWSAAHLGPLVRDRHLRGQLAVYIFARVPSGMMVLSLLLYVHARLTTLAGTGVVVACYGVAVAVTAPTVGRWADRLGPRPVLRAAAVTHFAGGAVLLAGHSAAVLCLGAALAGAGLPPTAACMRAQWRNLPERTRAAVFAVDGVVIEFAGVVGPLFVAVLTALWSPEAGIAVAATLSATAAFIAAGVVSFDRSGPAPERHWLGPLACSAVTRLLAVIALITAAIAILEVSAVAYTARLHHPALAGVLFAAMAAGSVSGGVLFAARPVRTSPRALLPKLCLLSAAGFLLLPLAGPRVWLLAALFALSNVAIAPLFATLFNFLGQVAPAGQVAETFTWASSSNFAAISGGTALGGVLVSGLGPTGSYVVAAGLLVLAAGCAAAAARTPDAEADGQPAHPRRPVVTTERRAPRWT